MKVKRMPKEQHERLEYLLELAKSGPLGSMIRDELDGLLEWKKLLKERKKLRDEKREKREFRERLTEDE